MNLLQIQQECGRLLSDPLNDRWSASVLTTRINLAQTEIQGYTSAVKTLEQLTPVAGTNAVTINSGTMNVLRVNMGYPDGSFRTLPGISQEELDFRYPDYQQWQTGQPIAWVLQGTDSAIYLYPAPSALFAITNGLRVLESRKPADLVNPTDIPFDSNTPMIPYHYAIVNWVVAHCFQDDGTPEALAKAKFHMSGNMLRPGQYEDQLGRIMAEFDAPEDVPPSILWQPEGGRVGSWSFPSKSNPIPF